MEKSLSSRSDSSSTAASTNRSLRLRARSIALRSDRSTLSRCQFGTYASAGLSPFDFGSAAFCRAMTPSPSTCINFGQEVADDHRYFIRAFLVRSVRSTLDFNVGGVSIHLG